MMLLGKRDPKIWVGEEEGYDGVERSGMERKKRKRC